MNGDGANLMDGATLLITAPAAARALSISQRTLWGLTKEKRIPFIRIGRSVRYDPRDLMRWIDEQKTTVDECDVRDTILHS